VELDGEGIEKCTREKILRHLSFPVCQGEGSDGLVVSEIETGVKVFLYLPVTQSKGTLRPKPSDETVGDKEFILVVEDDDTGVGITRTMLEKLGFHVLEAKTGMEAIYLVKGFEGNIKLVFLDSVLADMGGLEVYTLLNEILPHTKVIVLGGYVNDDLVQGILDAGAQTVIEKPFTLETLKTKITAIFEEK
jgi:CheY-like chemotaxis protein